MNYYQTQKLLCSKGNSRMKKQSTDWEKTFVSYLSNKGLLFRIYPATLETQQEETTNPVEKWAQDLNR